LRTNIDLSEKFILPDRLDIEVDIELDFIIVRETMRAPKVVIFFIAMKFWRNPPIVPNVGIVYPSDKPFFPR
jgi:hypothetical protein